MQSTRLRILSVFSARQYRGRLPHTTSRFNSTFKANGKDSSLSQGHVTNPSQSAQRDPQSQSARAGLDKNKSRGGKSSSQMDAASPTRCRKLLEQERATQCKGFADQVGSASGSENTGARGSKKNGSEEAASPGFFNTLKKMLGFKTSSREVKPGGTGVTGAASTPPDSTRYVGKRARTEKRRQRILQIWPLTHRESRRKNLCLATKMSILHTRKKGTGIAGRAMLQRSQCCHHSEEKGSRRARMRRNAFQVGRGDSLWTSMM
jgi:hypothetical protein